MTQLVACVKGIGVLGPGIANWHGAAAMLRGEVPYVSAPAVLPPPTVLPPAERRRAGRAIKLALAVGAEALAHANSEAASLVSVFSSSGGDGDNCHAICMTLASEDRQISPTRFHNSVHNAAAGYWSIAYGCTAASTALCAHDASLAAGLLEAAAQLGCGAPAVLMLAYDTDYPQPLRAVRDIPDAFGVALILVPEDSAGTLARLRIDIGEARPDRMGNAQLEAVRTSIPAARALPLLDCLANRRNATVTLDYLDNARLMIEVRA